MKERKTVGSFTSTLIENLHVSWSSFEIDLNILLRAFWMSRATCSKRAPLDHMPKASRRRSSALTMICSSAASIAGPPPSPWVATLLYTAAVSAPMPTCAMPAAFATSAACFARFTLLCPAAPVGMKRSFWGIFFAFSFSALSRASKVLCFATSPIIVARPIGSAGAGATWLDLSATALALRTGLPPASIGATTAVALSLSLGLDAVSSCRCRTFLASWAMRPDALARIERRCIR
mmetsp:Transcript_48058/g.134236  ORF Transcript_48058/g.134236 Transcript_48058/m.134236 type:complete len:235 (-) Transcript_48058:6944-7648(-)